MTVAIRLARRLGIGIFATLVLQGCGHLVVLRDPLTASEHNDLGVSYESAGEAALAAKQYRKSLQLEPRQSLAWVNLGNLDAATGHWGAAQKSYRRALRESSTDPDAMNNLAIALFRQGRNPTEARAWAERAVAIGGARDSLYRATLTEVSSGTR